MLQVAYSGRLRSRYKGAGMTTEFNIVGFGMDEFFTRCNGNPCFEYCKACKRNVVNSPVDPTSDRQWWMGPWIMEDEKCPSFTEMNRGAE